MNNTKCPNLVEWLDWVILLCERGNRSYVPDIYELKQFCKRDYHRCPFYSMNKADNLQEITKYPGEANPDEVYSK
jgi:hypothetical protein